MSEEKPLWNGTPSQVVNLPAFIIWGLLFWLVVPIFVIFWLWLVTRCTRYELTTQRLKTRHGVLNKKMDELELYRVRDYKFDQPIFLRLFGLGNITLHTSDKSDVVVTIRAIPNGEQLHEQLRSAVEACRIQKRVREVDFE
jgi:uncharacterized membrane protein YdbT with pleckstrin-like domain